MRNKDTWSNSKYVYAGGRLTASRDPKEVGIGSRLITDLVARAYDDNLRVHARGKLLDLGCGKVPLYCAYEPFITGSVCVDWGNTPHKNDHLDLEADLTEPLPLPDSDFDTVVMSDVLEHIPEPALLCQEIARVLKDDGTLLMNVPFYYWLHEQPHDFYRYTEFALRRLMQGAGLEVVSLQPIGGAPEILADIFSKMIIRTSRFGPILAKAAQSLALWYVGTGRGRRLSEFTRNSFPFGYFMVARKVAGHAA